MRPAPSGIFHVRLSPSPSRSGRRVAGRHHAGGKLRGWPGLGSAPALLRDLPRHGGIRRVHALATGTIPVVRIGRLSSPERAVAAERGGALHARVVRQSSRLGRSSASVVLRDVDQPRLGTAESATSGHLGLWQFRAELAGVLVGESTCAQGRAPRGMAVDRTAGAFGTAALAGDHPGRLARRLQPVRARARGSQHLRDGRSRLPR